MLILVGSTNPVKINAVKIGTTKAFPEAKITSFKAKSKISDQPIGEKETRLGAFNRAQDCLENNLKADLGVGLEGGVIETNIGMLSTAWCCIVDRKGKISYGGGMHFHIPENIAEKIRNGGELGPIMDDLLQTKNSKQHHGAIGTFTRGILNRTEAYAHLVKLALTKFITPEFYY